MLLINRFQLSQQQANQIRIDGCTSHLALELA
jgi:hypothetical protein